MRADRLLSLLLLLQVHRRMTAGDMARRLEVSERTIHRDMEALSVAGVPVLAERGAGGGWSLPDGYQTNLTGLTPEEAQALLVLPAFRALADLGMRDATEAALVKLQAALPASRRRVAGDMRQRIYIDMGGWQRSGESVAFLPALQDAVWQDRKLLLSYQRADGTGSERLVDPLGLVAKGSTWYLVGGVEGEVRTYRVSRIRELRVTGEAAARPAEFDLAAHWQQAQAEFVAALPRFPVAVRVDPAILPRIRYLGKFARIQQVGTPEADGWVPVFILFEEEIDAREYCLGFGPQLEVLEPPDLRRQVAEAARATVARYAAAQTP